GKGVGETVMLGACPGGRRVAEVVADGANVLLAVRDLRSLRVLFERRLSFSWGGRAPAAVACVDVAGAQALVFATDRRRPSKSTIVRVTRRTTATVWHGSAIAAWLGPGHAYLTVDGGRLLAFSLASGRTTVVARLPVLTGAV